MSKVGDTIRDVIQNVFEPNGDDGIGAATRTMNRQHSQLKQKFGVSQQQTSGQHSQQPGVQMGGNDSHDGPTPQQPG
jgi:hypothetical protein